MIPVQYHQISALSLRLKVILTIRCNFYYILKRKKTEAYEWYKRKTTQLVTSKLRLGTRKSSLKNNSKKKGTFVHILLLNEHFLELLFKVPRSSLFIFW